MTLDKPQPRSSFAAVPSTSWTLLQRIVAAETNDRNELLGQLVRRYWKPLYAYYRSKGKSPADSEDLVQGLLLTLPTRSGFPPDKDKTPRFRAWLLTCARNHLISAKRHDDSEIRKPATPIIPLALLRTEDGAGYEPAAGDNPEQAFRDAWRRSLLERALAIVESQAEREGRPADVQIFLDYYASDLSEPPTWQQLAERHGLARWKEAVNKADWVKRQLARAVRDEVRGYVNSEDEVDDEMRDLLG